MCANLDDLRRQTLNFWDEEEEEIKGVSSKQNLSDRSSPVEEFYKDETVFITGATGFLGTLLVEKLLRCCPHLRKLILLVRGKGSQSVQERVNNYFSEDIFDTLRLSNPNYHEKVEIVCGQLDADNFGLTQSDAHRLLSQTSIVFHIAATVRFDECIRVAYNINVQGTKTALSLARNMPRLKSFVYVSTAYSNCDRQFIREAFYPPPFTEEQLSVLVSCASDEELDILNEIVTELKPNTYTLTKAAAEDLVREASQDLPVCVFRPSIVFPTLHEPLPIWMKGFNGVIAVGLVQGMGLMRVGLNSNNSSIDVVPADLTINALTTLAWYNASQRPDNPVYNYVSYNINNLTLQMLRDVAFDEGIKGIGESSDSALWVPHVYITQSTFIFYTLFYTLHFIPAIVFSLGEKLTHRKPRILKTFRKIIFFTRIFQYFALNTWAFESENTRSMVNAMSESDRKCFESSMSSFRWETMAALMPRSSALYLLKERITKEHYQSKMFIRYRIDYLFWLTMKGIALYLFLDLLANQLNHYFFY